MCPVGTFRTTVSENYLAGLRGSFAAFTSIAGVASHVCVCSPGTWLCGDFMTHISAKLAERMDVALRCLVGIGGSYIVAALIAVALAQAVPMNDRDAVVLGEVTGFIVFGAAVIWAFIVQTLRTLLFGMIGAVLAAYLLFWVCGALA